MTGEGGVDVVWKEVVKAHRTLMEYPAYVTGRLILPRVARNRVSVGMTPIIPKRRGRKRHLLLEVVGLEGPLGAPPSWERQLIEPALAKMLEPKRAKAGEARDETAS